MSHVRTIHLPLSELGKCHECNKKKDLRLCSACGERTYCSAECQKKDWPSHKSSCGKTDRIDIGSFYPFMACLAESAHQHSAKPTHPAVKHTIVNSPNPGSHPAEFPDGSAANLILLGDPISWPREAGDPKWWPSALSPKVRSKLLRRIMREGYALQIATAICIGLLSEIYTTTSVPASESPDGELQRRIRLKYKTSPIMDFGVITGSANVKNQDRLAYLNLTDNSFAPAFFRERIISRSTPELHTERRRMSVLRNENLHRVAASGLECSDFAAVQDFMEGLSGRKMSEVELDLALKYTRMSCGALGVTLQSRVWTTWPKEPTLAIEADPGEMVGTGEGDSEAWYKYMKKWRSQNKKAAANKEALNAAFWEWDAKRKAAAAAKQAS
ncbi:hypothetical protein C8J57DRAFT_1595127 [Mycena rebaudengoi]|nr:hypothetical protein C8J57DRAFT_1595127 [Mycena rebaudengoi]